MSQELLPCPFCGNGEPITCTDETGLISVVCSSSLSGCGASGGLFDSEEQAITGWNTRPTAQAVAVDDAMVVRALRAFGDAMDEAGFLTYGGMDVGSRQDCILAALQAAMGGVA